MKATVQLFFLFQFVVLAPLSIFQSFAKSAAGDSASREDSEGKRKGVCTEKKMATIPTKVDRLQSCNGNSVASSAQTAEDKFFEACEKSAEAKAQDEEAHALAAETESKVKADTFSQGDVGALEETGKKIEGAAKVREEAIALFEEAKGAAEKALAGTESHKDKKDSHKAEAESLLAMIEWILEKEREKAEGAAEMAAAAEAAAGAAGSGYAKKKKEKAEEPSESPLPWTVPEEQLAPWASGGGETSAQTPAPASLSGN